MNAASHVTAECLAPALDVMEQAWPEGEEHMAKLAVNSMIGLMAHDSNKGRRSLPPPSFDQLARDIEAA